MSGNVAVAIIHHREPTTPAERLSLRHAERYLSDYDVYAVTPAGIRLGSFQHLGFPDEYFASLGANNLLRLSRRFYDRFDRYEYLLVYELDSLVLNEHLNEFCTGEYDYIGAPWVKYDGGRPVGLAEVGNSGFTVRRVAACLEVLTSNARIMRPLEYWSKIGRAKPGWKKALGIVGAASKILHQRNDITHFVQQYIFSASRTWSPHEDKFWHLHAPRFHPGSRIASERMALRFSFEHAPAFLYELNGRRLPLGCHAWSKHDPGFWASHLAL